MAAPTPRKRPAARKKPVAGNPNVIQLDRKENKDRFAEREPLFSIDGVEYTIPKHVPASWTIQATNIAATQGEAAALMWVTAKMLSAEAMDALYGCETLTEADLSKIVDIMGRKVLNSAGDVVPKD